MSKMSESLASVEKYSLKDVIPFGEGGQGGSGGQTCIEEVFKHIFIDFIGIYNQFIPYFVVYIPALWNRSWSATTTPLKTWIPTIE